MDKLFIRIGVSLAIAVLLGGIGVEGNTVVLQTLFTVLGIVFSISMSLLVSFNLSKVLNDWVRKDIRTSIGHLRNMLLADFSVSTLELVVALLFVKDNSVYRYFDGYIVIDVQLIALCIITMSLIYEAYNFKKLHDLHCSIEDRLIKEHKEHKTV